MSSSRGLRPTAASVGRVVVVAVLLAAIATSMPASPALADDNALILPGGEASVTLGTNAVLRVDGRLRSFRNCTSPGINDFVYPATDVYVVESSFDPLTSPELFPVLEDVTGTPSTIVQGGSAFLEQIIAITGPSGTLGPGTYSVVYDTCQDGRYQRTQGDQVFPNVITVVYPPVIPPEDPAIAALKANATTDFGRWQEIGKLFDSLVAVDSLANCAFGSVNNCLGVLAIWVDSPSVKNWISTYGKVKSAAQCATGNAGACFGILSDYWGFSQTPIRDSVVGGAKSLIANQAKAFFGIAADPPRADFATPTSATLDFPVPMVHGAGPVIDSMAQFATALEREQMLWTAFLAAIERYQGARSAGDPAAAVAQARSAAGIASALADAVPTTVDLLDGVFDTTLTEIPDFDVLSQSFNQETFRWYTTGFTPDEDRRLRNAGIAGSERATYLDERRTTSAETGGITAPFMNLAPITALQSDEVARVAALRQASTDLLALAASITGPVGDVPTITLPAVTTATTGTPFTVAATTSPGTTVTWDLDVDGSFDDATGPSATTTFRRAGHRVIAALATGPSGTMVTAHALVDVSAGNAPPTIVSAVPDTDGDDDGVDDTAAQGTVGAPTTFTVSAIDPEAEALTYEWFLDGAYVEGTNGPSLAITPTAPQRGEHTVSVTISDPNPGNVAQEVWRWVVDDPDADLDGWSANADADCDDSNGEVNPARIEQLFNGLDDDCDPATPDAPVGLGTGGEVWSWGQGFGTARGDDPAPGPIPGLSGVVAVKSWFRHGYALMSDGRVLGWGNGNDGVGGFPYAPTPQPVYDIGSASGTLGGVVELTDGDPTVFARRSDGGVVSWGYEYSRGSLGSGSTIYARAYPDRVLGPDTDGNSTPDPITDVVRVFQLGEAGMAQQSDGTLLQWGWRQCQGVQPIDAATSVAVVDPALTTALAGLVQATGNGNTGGTAIFRLADGSVFACGLRAASFVRSDNLLYRLESPTISFGPANPAIDVDTRPNDFWVVTADGKVWVRSFDPMVNSVPGCTAATCPSNVLHEVPMPPGAPVVDVETDSGEVHLRRSDGTIVTFGVNTFGATGHPEPDNTTTAETPSALAIDGFVIGSSPSGWNGLALVIPDAAIAASSWLPPQTDVEVSAVGATGPEGGSATAQITLSRPVSAEVNVSWRFDGRTGTTAVPAGLTSVGVPLVLPALDGIWGVDRQREFELVAVSTGATLADEVGSVTVTDADPVPILTIMPTDVAEGDGALTGHQMTLTLSGPAGVDLLFAVESSDGTARSGTDYKPVDVDALVPAGSTSATAPLVVLGNSVAQPDRTLRLAASAANRIPIAATTVVTIDDDDPLSFTARAPRTTPGVPARITLTVPAIPEGESVSFDWATADGTATSGTDFDAATGRVTITGGPNGTGTGTITIATRPAPPTAPLSTAATAALLADDTPSTVEALGLTVTLEVSDTPRRVLGPSQVSVTIERTTQVQPPPTTVPPTTAPPATVPAATVPPATIPSATVPATPVGGGAPTPPTTPSDVELPATGGDVTDVLLVAAGLLASGLMLRSGRRRPGDVAPTSRRR